MSDSITGIHSLLAANPASLFCCLRPSFSVSTHLPSLLLLLLLSASRQSVRDPCRLRSHNFNGNFPHREEPHVTLTAWLCGSFFYKNALAKAANLQDNRDLHPLIGLVGNELWHADKTHSSLFFPDLEEFKKRGYYIILLTLSPPAESTLVFYHAHTRTHRLDISEQTGRLFELSASQSLWQRWENNPQKQPLGRRRVGGRDRQTKRKGEG